MMEFDKSKIGMVVLLPGNKYSFCTGKPSFRLVTGYDFINNKYLFFSNSSDRKIVENNIQWFSYAEAIQYIDASIASLQGSYDHFKALLYPAPDQESLTENYQNELLHLGNAYYNTIESISVLTSYIRFDKDLYERELKSYQKSLRRLEKRFHFFFGKDGKEVVKTIQEGMMAGGQRGYLIGELNYIKYDIAYWESAKQKLTDMYTQFKNTAG